MSVKYALKVAPEAGGDRTDREGVKQTDVSSVEKTRLLWPICYGGAAQARDCCRCAAFLAGFCRLGQMPVVRPRAKARRVLHDDCPSLLTPPHLNLTLTSFSSSSGGGGGRRRESVGRGMQLTSLP